MVVLVHDERGACIGSISLYCRRTSLTLPLPITDDEQHETAMSVSQLHVEPYAPQMSSMQPPSRPEKRESSCATVCALYATLDAGEWPSR